MISRDELDKTILDLETHDTTYATCERLAWLYIVRDHLNGTQESRTASTSGNEFLEACNGKPIDGLMNLFSEHMSVLEMIYPKEYSAILQKIREL